jgi:predicted DNA binding CopG/RHH family protein
MRVMKKKTKKLTYVPRSPKLTILTLRVPKVTKTLIKARAVRMGVTMSQYTNQILSKHI